MRHFLTLGLFLLLLCSTGCAKSKMRPLLLEERIVEQPIALTPTLAPVPAPVTIQAQIYTAPAPAVLKPAIKSKRLIVIDPGHGGNDEGTQSLSKPRYTEKHLNLATAKMLQGYLKQMGYATLMTRTDDTFITLEKRAQIANAANPDLFVSVHYNSAPSQKAEGIEVYYYRSDKNKSRTETSKILAQFVLNKVIQNTDAKSRGVKHGDLSVIRETKIPAILVEGGFLTHEGELQKLKDPSYLKRVAWGIAQGIQEHINALKK